MVLLDLLHVQRAGFFKFLKLGIDKELSQLNINVENTRLQVIPFSAPSTTYNVDDSSTSFATTRCERSKRSSTTFYIPCRGAGSRGLIVPRLRTRLVETPLVSQPTSSERRLLRTTLTRRRNLSPNCRDKVYPIHVPTEGKKLYLRPHVLFVQRNVMDSSMSNAENFKVHEAKDLREPLRKNKKRTDSKLKLKICLTKGTKKHQKNFKNYFVRDEPAEMVRTNKNPSHEFSSWFFDYPTYLELLASSDKAKRHTLLAQQISKPLHLSIFSKSSSLKNLSDNVTPNKNTCFRLIAPKYTPREAILYQKSWTCKLVVKVLLTVRLPSADVEKNQKLYKSKIYNVPSNSKAQNCTKLWLNGKFDQIKNSLPFCKTSSYQRYAKTNQKFQIKNNKTKKKETNICFGIPGDKNATTFTTTTTYHVLSSYEPSLSATTTYVEAEPTSSTERRRSLPCRRDVEALSSTQRRSLARRLRRGEAYPGGTHLVDTLSSIQNVASRSDAQRVEDSRSFYLPSDTRSIEQDLKKDKQIHTINHELFLVLGELPLMTKRGHFIIHGSPRVILSQLIRKPGIYFTQKNNELQADCIPEQGPWLCIYKNLSDESTLATTTTEGRRETRQRLAIEKFSREENGVNIHQDRRLINGSTEDRAKLVPSPLQDSFALNESKSSPLILGNHTTCLPASKTTLASKDKSQTSTYDLATSFLSAKQVQPKAKNVATNSDVLVTQPSWAQVVVNGLTNRKFTQASYFCYTKQFSSMPFSLVYSTFRVFELHSQFTDQTLLLTKLKTLEKIHKFKDLITTLLTFTWKKRIRKRLQRLYTKRCFISTQQFEKTKVLFRLKKKLILGSSSRKSFNEKLGVSSCIETGLTQNVFDNDYFDNKKITFALTNPRFVRNVAQLVAPFNKSLIHPPSLDFLSKSKISLNSNLTYLKSGSLKRSFLNVPVVGGTSMPLSKLNIRNNVSSMAKNLQNYVLLGSTTTTSETGLATLNNDGTPASFALQQGKLRFGEARRDRQSLRRAFNVPSSYALTNLRFVRGRQSLSVARRGRQSLSVARRGRQSLSVARRASHVVVSRRGRQSQRFVVAKHRKLVVVVDNLENGDTPSTSEALRLPSMPLEAKLVGFNRRSNVVASYSNNLKDLRNKDDLGYESKVQNAPCLNSTTLLSRDLALIVRFLDSCKILQPDDIDDLNNQRIRTSSDQIQQQVRIGLFRFKKMFLKLISPVNSGGTSQTITDLLNGALREFFGSNPLSQFLDQTNPLAEITHKRRISKLGIGGIQRESATLKVRTIHSTYFGRICPIETPEGLNAGLVNSLTCLSRVDEKGQLVTPLSLLMEGQKQEQFFYYSNKENTALSTTDTALLKFHRLPNQFIYTKNESQFQQLQPNLIKLRVKSDLQTISLATALIPFLAYDDANRALMGSNMQRQAVPLILPERPIVRTGMESLVTNESGHSFQASSGGFVSYTSAQYVIILCDTLNKRLLV